MVIGDWWIVWDVKREVRSAANHQRRRIRKKHDVECARSGLALK
jgi:hypothetical protein